MLPVDGGGRIGRHRDGQHAAIGVGERGRHQRIDYAGVGFGERAFAITAGHCDVVRIKAGDHFVESEGKGERAVCDVGGAGDGIFDSHESASR